MLWVLFNTVLLILVKEEKILGMFRSYVFAPEEIEMQLKSYIKRYFTLCILGIEALFLAQKTINSLFFFTFNFAKPLTL